MSQSRLTDPEERETRWVRAELDAEEFEFLRIVTREAGLTWAGMLKAGGDRVIERLDEHREGDVVEKVRSVQAARDDSQ